MHLYGQKKYSQQNKRTRVGLALFGSNAASSSQPYPWLFSASADGFNILITKTKRARSGIQYKGAQRNGGGRIIEEDDSDAGGDGEGQGASALQGPVRPPPDPAQQVPAGRVVPPLEVRG